MGKNSRSVYFIGIILLASVAIQAPLYNRAAVFFDEGIIFNLSETILKGNVLYRDKPCYVFPGIFYLLALLYKIFGVSYLVSRYAMAAVFTATALLVFLISRRLMAEWLAFLTALVFVAHRVWAFPIWNMIGYATFSMFSLGLALLSLMKFNEKPSSTTAFLTGGFIAVATMFKQDYGAFAGAGIFLYLLLWPRLRVKWAGEASVGVTRAAVLGCYILAGVLVSLPVLGYFSRKGALDDLLNNTLLIPLRLETTRGAAELIPIFPLLHQDSYLRANLYHYVPHIPFGFMLWSCPVGKTLFVKTALWDVFLKLVHYSPYLSMAGVAILLGKRYIRNELSIRFENMTAALVVCAFVFLTQHRPFDFAHLMQMYVPVFVLLGCIVDSLRLRFASRKLICYMAFGGSGIFLLLYLCWTIFSIRFTVKAFPAKFVGPRANIYVARSERDVLSEAVRFVTENTAADEPIFVFPYHSLFYFLSERPNPTRFEVLWPVKVFPSMDQEIINVLEHRHVRYLVYAPGIHPSIGDFKEFAPEIAHYVENTYIPEKVFGDPQKGPCFIIMRRKVSDQTFG